MPWVGVVARLVVGGVWVAAGLLKLPDPTESVRAVRNYQLLPEAVVPLVGHALPVLEVLIGVCLILGVLVRASAIRTGESLRFVLPYVDNPTLSEAACLGVVELAHHRGLREPNKVEFDAALDKVIATSKDEVVIDRANRYKRGQTWARPTS